MDNKRLTTAAGRRDDTAMKNFALIGRRLGHSYSQRWFEALFRELGLEGYSYRLHEMESLEGLREWVAAEGIGGFNVTVPYKQAVIPFLDELSPEAAAIGAVNCVAVGADGRLTGHNTDAPAFRQTLEELLAAHRLHPSYAYILGTGGAARAVAYALDQMGLDYSFVSRNPRNHDNAISYETLNQILKHLSTVNQQPSTVNCQLSTENPLTPPLHSQTSLPTSLPQNQPSTSPNFNFQFSIFNSLIVNATPVGMYPDTNHSPLPPFTSHLSPFTSHLSPFTSHPSLPNSLPNSLPTSLPPSLPNCQLSTVNCQLSSPPNFNFQFSIFNSLIVYDLIYNPSPTLLMRQAAAAGAVTTDGLAMLHRQATLSWQIFGPEELRLKGADGR